MISEQILQTLKYFDLQDHPLTLLELHKYLLADKENLDSRHSISEILNCIESELKDKVSTRLGLYMLTGREALAEQRLKNNYYGVVRRKRANKYLPRARFVPFIRAVSLGGSEALSKSKESSDIDVLVITAPNRIWLGRVFLTMYFQLFGVRRYGDVTENRFCLNHYIQTGKKVTRDTHIYTAIEYSCQIPYYGGEYLYEFQKANEEWISEYLAQPQFVKEQTSKQSGIAKAIEWIFDNRIGDQIERWLGELQTKRIQLQEGVTVEKDELSFHPGVKGRKVTEAFKANV